MLGALKLNPNLICMKGDVMQIADENYVKAYGESVLREKADRDYISARILYYYQLYENYIYFISQA